MIDSRLPRLVQLRHVRDHVLWLRYSDGIQGEVDLGDSLTATRSNRFAMSRHSPRE